MYTFPQICSQNDANDTTEEQFRKRVSYINVINIIRFFDFIQSSIQKEKSQRIA
jgi:hypothetical protein